MHHSTLLPTKLYTTTTTTKNSLRTQKNRLHSYIHSFTNRPNIFCLADAATTLMSFEYE